MKVILACLIVMLSVILVSCGKDKFTTEPQVDVKSITPSEVFVRNLITLRAKFTDQEGDLDSVLVVYKWYDGNTVSRLFDTLRNSVAGLGIPDNTKQGDVVVQYAYGTIDGYTQLGGTPVSRDTTVTFGLVLRDKKGNRSNYSESDRIRFKR